MSLLDKIKMLFAIRQPATELVDEVKTIKSGWKTVEFWVSVLATLGAIAAGLTGFLPATTALIITTVITILYNIVRAIQNAGTVGITPLLLSTRFWMGILGIIATGLAALQTGGINPAWLVSVSGVIGAIMAGAQSVGSAQPTQTAQLAPPANPAK